MCLYELNYYRIIAEVPYSIIGYKLEQYPWKVPWDKEPLPTQLALPLATFLCLCMSHIQQILDTVCLKNSFFFFIVFLMLCLCLCCYRLNGCWSLLKLVKSLRFLLLVKMLSLSYKVWLMTLVKMMLRRLKNLRGLQIMMLKLWSISWNRSANQMLKLPRLQFTLCYFFVLCDCTLLSVWVLGLFG